MKAPRLTIICSVILSAQSLVPYGQAKAEGLERLKMSSWGQQELKSQRRHIFHAHGHKSIVVAMTVYPDVTVPDCVGFVVDADAVCDPFRDTPARGNEYGGFKLPSKIVHKLHTLLSKLPSSNQSDSATRVVVSSFRHHKWTTRIYDGKTAHGTLQALLAIPGQNGQGYPDCFVGYTIGERPPWW